MVTPEQNHEAIERLLKDQRVEMNQDEIDRLIDLELKKPPETMDTRLLDDALHTAEQEEISQKAKDADWQTILSRMDEKQKIKTRRRRTIARVASVAAAVVVFFAATIGAANAFRWTFLLRLLAPVAQTFGIYVNLESPVAAQDSREVYTDEKTRFTQLNCTDIQDMPSTYLGYPIVLKGIPERYQFVQGSLYDDKNMVNATLFYQNSEEWISVVILIYSDETDTSAYDFEKTSENVSMKQLGNIEVTFYRNSDDNIVSVSWIDKNAHYHIQGHITEEELTRITNEQYGG